MTLIPLFISGSKTSIVTRPVWKALERRMPICSKLIPPPAATLPSDSNVLFNSLALTPHPRSNCAARCVSANPNGGVSAKSTTSRAASAALDAPPVNASIRRVTLSRSSPPASMAENLPQPARRPLMAAPTPVMVALILIRPAFSRLHAFRPS